MSARASSDQSILGPTLLRVFGDLVRGQPELGEYFLDRDSFSAALFEPSFGAGEGLALGVGNRLVVERSVGDGLGNRVHDDPFQDTDHGGKLGRLELIDQLMRLLFFR